jgi:hypothetical protein
MSAYAMPGLLPPLAGFTCMDRKENKVDSNLSHSYQFQMRNFIPLKSPLQFKPICFSAISPSSLNNDTLSTDSESEHYPILKTTRFREVGISVKDAKLDLARFIKSLKAASSYGAVKRVKPIPIHVPIQSKITDFSSHDNDPHKEAIQFELNISFNGRTYNATRTLPNLVQLRHDLISEIKNRRKALRSRRWMPTRSLLSDLDYAMDEKSMDADDDTVVSSLDDDDDDDDEYLVCIPELPEYYLSDDTKSTGGFAGRGFTFLHALLRSYCPVIEGWLRKVTDLVPPNNSPSLSRFLWEPISVEGEDLEIQFPSSQVRNLNGCFTTLASIQEDGEIDDDDDYENPL